MSQSQSVLISTLACSTLLLTGALGRQDLPPAPLAPSLFTPRSAPSDARPLLDELAQKPVHWLSAKVWQKMADGENRFEATGTLHRGPGNKFRLEMRIASQQTAQLCIISDGTSLRQEQRIGYDKPTVQCTTLASADGTTAAPDAAGTTTAFVALLRRLRDGLRDATVQSGLWQDLPVLRVAGTWTPRDDTPAEFRPPLQPRICHVYLDARTHWPVRVEWWGAEHPADTPSLLLQMEFRDLTINRPLSPEETSRLFCCSPSVK